MHKEIAQLPAEFARRRVLVTGGSRGIGAAIARRFLEAGAAVVTSARSRTRTHRRSRRSSLRTLRSVSGAQKLVDDSTSSSIAPAQPHLDGNIPDDEWLDALNINFLSRCRWPLRWAVGSPRWVRTTRVSLPSEPSGGGRS